MFKNFSYTKSKSVKIFFIVYDYLFVPLFLTLTLTLGLLLSSKIRLGFTLRRNHKPPKLLNGCIWIHASSGEFEYAKTVITDIKSTDPSSQVLVTYFSPSYAKQIASYPGVDYAIPLPIESRAAVRDFIKKINPKVLLIARTDIWPQVLLSCAELKIPTLLFSCTFRPLNLARRFFKFYYKIIFNLLSEIFAVSETDYTNLSSSQTSTKISVQGDTRFDQVLLRIENPKPLSLQVFSDSKSKPQANNHVLPIMVAGSTWHEDELILVSAASDFLKENSLRLIIAPHEPSPRHIAKLKTQFLEHQIHTQLYSENELWVAPVLIVDQMGILAEIYTKGSFAFVGGSFKSKVHSVMEPLAAGLPVIVGPKFANNREAMIFNRMKLNSRQPNTNLNIVSECRTELEFKELIAIFTKENHHREQISSEIKHHVRSRSGATRHILSWLKEHHLISIS